MTAAVLLCASTASAVESSARWDTEPYRIRVVLAIDAPGDLREQLEAELPGHLDERVVATIGAPWRLEAELPDGPLREKSLRNLDQLTDADLGDELPVDKQLFLAVAATPWGYRLSAREFDEFNQRWSPALESTTRQREALPEELFALVRRAVTPLAKLQVHPDDSKRVTMSMRASALPRKSVDFEVAEPGDVFLPLVRRTTRDGELAENGIQAVPWTYIEVVPADDSPAAKSGDGVPQLVGRVHSGVPAPLSRRRRARTEQVAIALRPEDSRNLTVRLRSRRDNAKPLVGYEVQSQTPGDDTLETLGMSNDAGELQVATGPSKIQLLTVKSVGTVLARVPVVPGLGGEVEIPLPDDDVRLQAAARLASLREDLVDLVARRNIYVARVRQQIEVQNYDRARELLAALDQLPGRTQFNRLLDREAQQHRSSDPQVQRRIDELFTATQVVLGEFLDPRPIGELHDELQNAQTAPGSAGG